MIFIFFMFFMFFMFFIILHSMQQYLTLEKSITQIILP